MKFDEIVSGLKSLEEDRKSFFRKDGDDEVFRHDYAVLAAAIDAVRDLQEVIDNPGLGLCVICEYGPEKLTGQHCANCQSGYNQFKCRKPEGSETE